jgi:DNA-binding MarR family transcriptional regulator
MSRDRWDILQELQDEVRASQRATDAVDEAAAQALGINRTDGKCVDILEQHGRMSAGELAHESGLTTGAVTAVIDRLARAGYVQRVADPSDRRRVLVELTSHAREQIEELMGPLGDTGLPKLETYTDEQLELLVDFTRFGRELQERHAQWLREQLERGDLGGAGRGDAGGGNLGGAERTRGERTHTERT